MFAVIRHYHFNPKDSAEIDRRIREEFVPIIKKAKGFVRYYWLDTGKGEGASFSVFKDKAGADESVYLAADYVREHLSKLRTRKPEIYRRADQSSRLSADVADAHGGDGKRFVVHADEKLTAFMELESAICLVAYGYDGKTGAVVYDGGGSNELMAGTHYYSTTGIVARGHIYVAGDNKVYAFSVSRPSPIPRPHPTPHLRPTPPPRSMRSLFGRD